MQALINATYNHITLHFTEDGWFNATQVAERFGKKPIEWLRLPETVRYIDALCRRLKVGKSHFYRTRRGKYGGGTWMHPKLGIPFARWLDIDFAVWCDEQVEGLLKGSHPHYDWKRHRHQASASCKVLNQMLQMTRQRQGKTCDPHHYSNEARLINWALTGEFGKLDRERLSAGDLDLLAKLETLDSLLIGSGATYPTRKTELEQYAQNQRSHRTPAEQLHDSQNPNH